MVKILLLSFKVVYCEIRKISKTLQLLVWDLLDRLDEEKSK